MNSTNILLVGPLNRAAISMARGLKTADVYSIRLMCESKGNIDVIQNKFKSSAIDYVHFVKEKYHDTAFVKMMLKIIRNYKIDVVLPTATAAILVAKEKRELSKYCKVAVEDYDKVDNFHDKRKTILIARRLNIPHPHTLLSNDLDEIETYAHNANYPLVIKARKGSGANGVWYARNPTELLNLYREINEKTNCVDGFINDWSSPMIQDYIPGGVEMAGAFCVNGEIKAGFTQRHLVTKPLSGGEGIVIETTYNEELLEYARRIVEYCQWNGIIHFDFKIDSRDGSAKLLEVNPRFWTNLWLSVSAGLNYPQYSILQALGKNIEFSEDYEKGLTCRWPLLELQTIFERPSTFSAVRKRVGQFIFRFSNRNCEYNLNFSDFEPVIIKTWELLRRFLFRLRGRFSFLS
jgi:predicted ATP-grasp superfamily ATP-dependent carboligase